MALMVLLMMFSQVPDDKLRAVKRFLNCFSAPTVVPANGFFPKSLAI
jgi:hypothetical protein